MFRHLLAACTLLFLVISLVAPSPGYPASRTSACAKYLNTNKAYKVDVTIIRGSELNQKTYSFDYNGLATYAVIFWSDNQASVIELDFFCRFIISFRNTRIRPRRKTLGDKLKHNILLLKTIKCGIL